MAVLAAGALRAESGGDRIPDRVRIAGVDVSGLTPQEAERAVGFRVEQMSEDEIVLTSADGAGFRLQTTPRALGAAPRLKLAMEEAREPRGLVGRVLAGAGVASTREVELEYRLSRARVDGLIARLERALNRPAVDATARLVGGKIVVSDGRDGFGVDPDLIIAQLHELPDHIELRRGPLTPRIDLAEANRAKAQAERVLAGPTEVTFEGRGVEVPVAVKRQALRFEARPPRLLVRLSPGVIGGHLRPAFASRIQPARDADFRISGERVSVVPSQTGRRLAAREIALKMVRRPGAGSVPARFAVEKPELTTEEARELKIKELIATFSTPYSCCPPRVSNIQRAAEILDGTIIPAGNLFSLNDALGQRTADSGFVAAPQIAAGKLEDAVGGGVSQVATTIYNTAFFAGMEIVDHTPHDFFISRYPAGREATVSWRTPELIFRNDWDAAVLVKVIAGSGSITVSFYSSRLGRRIETTTGERTSFTSPEEHVTTNPDLEPGTRSVEQSAGGGGFTVTYTRTVYAGGDVKRDEDYTWTYRPQNAFIEEGPPAEEGAEEEGGTGTGAEPAPGEPAPAEPAPGGGADPGSGDPVPGGSAPPPPSP